MKRMFLSSVIAFGVLSFVVAGTTEIGMTPGQQNFVADTIPQDTVPKRDTTDIPDIPDSLSLATAIIK